MPYEEMTADNNKERYLISGMQNIGKTTSAMTFLFGPYDYLNAKERDKALSYAGDKTMVVIACPGEFGTRKALQHYIGQVPNLKVIGYQQTEQAASKTLEWSNDAMSGFNKLLGDLIKDPPDIVLFDGLHGLWDHGMNRISGGAWLEAKDLSITDAGTSNQYRSGGLYDRAHNLFGNYVSRIYESPIPLVIATVWEDWKGQNTDASRPGGIEATRYLWCDIPGKMATRVVGKFDARLSAMLYPLCFHDNCKYDKAKQEHYVWQFYPKNDVRGVGIKGLRLTEDMKSKPWIHQNYQDLKDLMEIFK